jgi:hypothetical protein
MKPGEKEPNPGCKPATRIGRDAAAADEADEYNTEANVGVGSFSEGFEPSAENVRIGWIIG